MLKIINGTFEEGNSIIIKDTETNEYYHKVIYKNSIEHNGELYYKEDFHFEKKRSDWRSIKQLFYRRCPAWHYITLNHRLPTK